MFYGDAAAAVLDASEKVPLVAVNGPGLQVEFGPTLKVTVGSGLQDPIRSILLSAGGGGTSSAATGPVSASASAPALKSASALLTPLPLTACAESVPHVAVASSSPAAAPAVPAALVPSCPKDGTESSSASASASALPTARARFLALVDIARDWFSQDFTGSTDPQSVVMASGGGSAYACVIENADLARATRLLTGMARKRFVAVQEDAAGLPPYKLTVVVDGELLDVFRDPDVVRSWQTRIR